MRCLLFCSVFVIYADTSEVLRILAEADGLGMLNGEFAFITIDIRLDAVNYNQHSLIEGNDWWTPIYSILLELFAINGKKGKSVFPNLDHSY